MTRETGTTMTTPQTIYSTMARLLTLRTALKLEMRGLRATKGRTAYSILQRDYGYKGSREVVLAHLDMVRDAMLGMEGGEA